MSDDDKSGTALELMESIKRKAPEYFDILTAKTDEQFDAAFDILLERALEDIETNNKNFADLLEVPLSAVLKLALSIPGLSVTQETHSNGHVDLTITADHCSPQRKKLAEAKMWDGPAYHIAGLEQLLRRYSTGRQGRGLVISYVRKKNIKGLFSKLREVMDKELPCEQQGATEDYPLKWSFLSTHAHSSGENLEVSHVGCNMYFESDKSTD